MAYGKHLDEVNEAVAKFNKYRSPEAHAELHSSGEESFEIGFSGHFCRSCGFHDYFDDLRIFLEESGIETEISDVKEGEEASVVSFRIVGKS